MDHLPRVIRFRFSLACKLIALMVSIAGHSDPVAAQNPRIGTCKNAIGTLLVIRADGIEERLRGQGSLQLFEGDLLKTDASSQALIVLADGIQVALNQNTIVKLLARWEKPKGNLPVLRMSQGEVWAKTGGASRTLEVETPVAIAAARDAELNLKVLPDGQSILTTIEGLVDFGTAFGTCPIRASSISYGKRGERCTKPTPTDAKAATAWISHLLK
jgi:ferric-dicitrate binding protein FerR (iron transport regulator)